MNMRRVFVTFLVAAVAAALIAPAVAAASQFGLDRSLFGLEMSPPQRWKPVIDGDNVIFHQPSEGAPLQRYNIATGAFSALPPVHDSGAWGAVVAGDWVAWSEHNDIHAKNLRTGAYKQITNDSRIDQFPSISDADGKYVVWESKASNEATVATIKAKNLSTTGSPFTVVSSTSTMSNPRIHGKHVVYVNKVNGAINLYMKTIGSSAAAKRLTSYAGTEMSDPSPSLGSHIVTWRAWEGMFAVKTCYYDFDTSRITTVSVSGNLVYEPRVSGDRFLMQVGSGTYDLRVFDTRIARTSEALALIDVTDGDEGYDAAIDGSRVVYRVGASSLHYVKLAVPGISLHSVPKRIAHAARIRLWGSISDNGSRIGGAKLDIEKLSSGRWVKIASVTANSSGEFSYYTPKNHSTTYYRVAYNGFMEMFGPPAKQHLSTASATKKAWPR